MKHIPSADTSSLPVLSFAEALRPTNVESYDRSAWIYVPDYYTDYRYLLGTRGDRPLICVGVNSMRQLFWRTCLAPAINHARNAELCSLRRVSTSVLSGWSI